MSAPPFDPWRSAVVAADVLAAAAGSAQEIAVRRASRLAALLQSAAARSPVYRERLRGRDPAGVALHELPVMRKADLMLRFRDWVCDPRLDFEALRRFVARRELAGEPFRGRYTVWESSGSSGEPGLFVQDPFAMSVYDALEALRRPPVRPLQRMLDPLYLGERFAFVGAIDGHFATTVSLQRLRRLHPMLADHVHLVSFLQPACEVVRQLDLCRPTIVATYPSAAVMLAEERLAGRLGAAPREIWTGGETLSDGMRAFVKQAFDCAVVNSYGASEFLSLACECGCGRLHLNSDWAILEPVDADGHPVPPGHAGVTTLLTNLANHVQPIIRYDLGDRVTIRPEPCDCGSPLPVIDVQGRSDDTLQLVSAGGQRVNVLPLALATVLEDEAGLFDFRLVQKGPRALRLHAGPQGADAEATLRRARTSLSAFLRRLGVDGVHIECAPGLPDTRGRTGKVRRVVALAEDA